jgi:hypothetical protein
VTNVGAGGYEYAQHQSKEYFGPSYDMVMSEKTGEKTDQESPYYLGALLPSAHSRTDDRGHAFWDTVSILDKS